MKTAIGALIEIALDLQIAMNTKKNIKMGSLYLVAI